MKALREMALVGMRLDTAVLKVFKKTIIVLAELEKQSQASAGLQGRLRDLARRIFRAMSPLCSPLSLLLLRAFISQSAKVRRTSAAQHTSLASVTFGGRKSESSQC